MFGRAQSIIGLGATRLSRNVFHTNPLSMRRFAMVSKQYRSADKNSDKNSDRNSDRNSGQSSTAVMRNDNIRFPLLRVVFTNSSTGEPDWQIMTRLDALSFAKKMDLDLILVNAKADPPVCKVEDFVKRVQEIKTKEKEVKASQKARSLKEMFMTGGIEKRDFLTKMKKVNEFLTRGHQVKVTVVPKRFLKNDRFKNGVRRDRMSGFDETILMLLEFLESLPLTMTEQKVKRPPPLTHLRNGQKIIVKKDDKAVATKASKPTGGDGAGSEGEGEKGELIDDDDLGGDDSDDEEEESTGPGGQRLVLRREFMLTPKGEMIEKPGKKPKEPRDHKDKDKDNK